LTHKGNIVTFDLEKNLDVIFCFDPRPNQAGVWYQHFFNYKQSNPNTKIIQRVGDVGTHSKPELTHLVKQTTLFSDHVIFTSEWAKNYISYNKDNYSVIPNAPQDIFYSKLNNKTIGQQKIKIVTHHWSDNPKKGFDIYSLLGEKIKNDDHFKDYEFTYIGRYNNSYSKLGINAIAPITGLEIVKELSKHDVYLTASLEEAGANHVLEALALKLPIIYRKGGGSINEYCDGFGYEYKSFEDLISILEKKEFINYMPSKIYSSTINDVVEKYWEITCRA
jgi:hypothetical protein